jgi:hypothetical protein
MINVRISEPDLEIIIAAFHRNFHAQDHLWLFGSRADLNKRGGDMDFYIETMETDVATAVDKKMSFVSTLWEKLGDQKIDVVLNVLSRKYSLPIYEIAKKMGVLLA